MSGEILPATLTKHHLTADDVRRMACDIGLEVNGVVIEGVSVQTAWANVVAKAATRGHGLRLLLAAAARTYREVFESFLAGHAGSRARQPDLSSKAEDRYDTMAAFADLVTALATPMLTEEELDAAIARLESLDEAGAAGFGLEHDEVPAGFTAVDLEGLDLGDDPTEPGQLSEDEVAALNAALEQSRSGTDAADDGLDSVADQFADDLFPLDLTGLGPHGDESIAGDLAAGDVVAPATNARPALVHIPTGTFVMGSPTTEEGRDGDEQWHYVTFTQPFSMAATSVTQAQYWAVMEKRPSHFEGDDLPVEQLRWSDAVAFCNALSEREGLSPAYDVGGEQVTVLDGADGYRLPTEAQWEYACRGGTTTPYWSGSSEADLGRVGWYGEGAEGSTHPVAEKPANAWGLYDMHGNVWEWCYDWNVGYHSRPQTDPAGPRRGAFRVIRGGSVCYPAHNARSACRFGLVPGYWDRHIGFRLVRPVPGARV